ncbi:MAG: hypothetical protein EON98_06245 [Chitinophagaceae bacterium]|nr:MAG: hypothetical protein EON98_06245 [Chitinophagaceae bacterium]
MSKTALLFCFFLSLMLFLLCPARGQNTIGIPMIVNYSSQAYNAGSQNWGMAQDERGILYFANNQGLLTFDGNYWRRYPLPNKTRVRSVAIGKDGRIYVGGQSELGYFSVNEKGELVYTSLMPLIDEKGKDFTDIWNICIFGNQVFFRAYRKLFSYDGHHMQIHEGQQWNFLGATAFSLFALNRERQLISFQNQRIAKAEGLQNNNVLCMLLDKDRNLWFGLDNGIDLALYNNAIQQIFPEGGDRNAGYASAIYNNKLYLGLVSGAYEVALENKTDLSYTKGVFRPIKGSKGQVWNFSVVHNQLFMGHNRGAFLINNDSAQLVDGSSGVWNFQPLPLKDGSQVLLAGSYNGINFYRVKEGQVLNPHVRAYFESARFVVQNQNGIWASHPFKGLFRVQYNGNGIPAITSYIDRQQILSQNNNKLFTIGGKMILLTDKGIFEYSDHKDEFIKAAQFEELNKVGVINYLKEDGYGNVWFTCANRVGVYDRSFKKGQIIFIPELNNKIQSNGFEQIHVIDSNNVLLTGEAGFFHLNYAQYKKTHYPLQAMISKISFVSPNDSLLYGGYARPSKVLPIDYAFNSLHFEVATTLFGHENTVDYSYYLEGFDKGWSEWGRRTEKEYTNIPPGNYVFKVRCRNSTDNESTATSFSFTVLPPWYRTWWAYTIYILTVICTLYLFYKKQQRKYKRQQQRKLQEQQNKYDEEQKRLQMIHQLTVAENERKISLLQREKLEVEIGHKNAELASSAMNLVHKAEILSRLKEDLLGFKETAQLEKGTKEFQKIIKLIDAELNHAGEWEDFARHFDSVHADYLKKLKENYPDLTTSELKLAAYLRLNLSTKEIAQLLGISVRGVETSRYRLRKKLGLTNEDANLSNFLHDVTK